MTRKMASGKSIIWKRSQFIVIFCHWRRHALLPGFTWKTSRLVPFHISHMHIRNTFLGKFNYAQCEFGPISMENKNHRVNEIIFYYNERLFFKYKAGFLLFTSIFLPFFLPSFLPLFVFQSFIPYGYFFKVKHSFI